MAVFGASVCQWPHNCVSEESRQIADRVSSSAAGFIECFQCLCLLCQHPAVCIFPFALAWLSFTKSFFFSKKCCFCGQSINFTFAEHTGLQAL